MKIKLTVFVLMTLTIQMMVTGQSATFSVNKAPLSSNKYDEFSPVYYKNGIVFTTNRPSFTFSSYSSEQNTGPLKINLFEPRSESKWEDAKLFSKDLKTKFNDGPVTFNATGDTIYFSRNLEVEGKLDDLSTVRNKLGIFYAVLVGKEWAKIRGLRINNEWYNVTTPWLSPDGKSLYIASDKPEGFGGFDIYCCQWKDDYWDNPVNLGPVINTAGNEAYPFVNQEGGLYFSSDGHPGLGGKDIFYSKPSGSAWLTPVDLDAPINSQFDDFALIADSVMGEGYFSSKRDNSIDVYHFKTNIHQLFYCQEQKANQYCFKFSDESKIPMNKDYVQYLWDFGDGSKEAGLNVQHCFPGPGKYTVKLDLVDKKSGRIFFPKVSYNLELKEVEQPIINSKASALIGESVKFDPMNSIFAGSRILSYTWYFGDGERTTGDIVSHSFKAQGEYEVKLGLILKQEKTGVVFEACTSKKVKVFKDEKEKIAFDSQPVKPTPVTYISEYDHAFVGNMFSAEKEFNQDAVFQIEIKSSKTRLGIDNIAFNNIPKKYSVKEVRRRNDGSYSYVIGDEMSLMDTYPAYSELVDLGFKEIRIRTFLPEDPAVKELNNLKKVFGVSADLLFHQNDFSLSSAGTQLLDLIIGFMSKYSGAKLEIATHTDDTGSPLSNQVLSQKRAESMANYLINNGVSAIRVIPRGYGGSKPITPNSNDAERRMNRRVDFTIVK